MVLISALIRVACNRVNKCGLKCKLPTVRCQTT
jgi:hypothetical protein